MNLYKLITSNFETCRTGFTGNSFVTFHDEQHGLSWTLGVITEEGFSLRGGLHGRAIFKGSSTKVVRVEVKRSVIHGRHLKIFLGGIL